MDHLLQNKDWRRPPLDIMVMYLRFRQNAENFLTSPKTMLFLTDPFQGVT
jgi:hypothetical protein